MNDKTADQLRECPFCGGKGVPGSHTVSDGTVLYNVRCRCGSGVNEFFYREEADEAWNTRPDSGEAAAWMVTRERDRTFPRTFTEKERAIACVDMVTLPPFAKIVDLYTPPTASPSSAVTSLVGKWRERKALDKSHVQAMREKTYEQCADELQAALQQVEGSECKHRWIDATNSRVSGTAVCLDCGKLAKLGTVEIDAAMRGDGENKA